jgi:hypothetical protein
MLHIRWATDAMHLSGNANRCAATITGDAAAADAESCWLKEALVLKSLFGAIALRLAARKYARRLGAQLRKDYGANEHYNRAQLEASARRAKLPMGKIQLGYAGFMTEEAFLALDPAEGASVYQELRSLLLRSASSRQPSAGIEPVPEDRNIMYAADWP